MTYYGYRWYDPVTGRWPSRDPIGEIGHETMRAHTSSVYFDEDLYDEEGSESDNAYAFSLNSPIHAIDVNGEWVWIPAAYAAYRIYRIVKTIRRIPKVTPRPPVTPTPRPTPGPKPKPKRDSGDCSANEHAYLQARVKLFCNQTRACSCPPVDCDTWENRRNIGAACVAARKEIMRRCFKGGDARHKKHLKDDQDVLKNCQSLINKHCN